MFGKRLVMSSLLSRRRYFCVGEMIPRFVGKILVYASQKGWGKIKPILGFSQDGSTEFCISGTFNDLSKFDAGNNIFFVSHNYSLNFQHSCFLRTLGGMQLVTNT